MPCEADTTKGLGTILYERNASFPKRSEALTEVDPPAIDVRSHENDRFGALEGRSQLRQLRAEGLTVNVDRDGNQTMVADHLRTWPRCTPVTE